MAATSYEDTAGPGLVTLLVIEVILGYEWLASGITKVASGTFVSGMAAALKESCHELRIANPSSTPMI
jgi:uncharacterized membrane protein YphA (DoxX/SURF4 family)